MSPQPPASDDSHRPAPDDSQRPAPDDMPTNALPAISTAGVSPSWPADFHPSWVGRHDAKPYHRGRLSNATHAAERDFPCCSDPQRTRAADDPVAVVDAIAIELLISPAGVIREAWFEGAGCRLSQATASRCVQRVEGLTLEQAKRFSAAEMLLGLDGGVPLGRQRCALLAWRVFQKALDCPRAYDNSDATTDLMDDEGDQVPRRFGGPSLEEEG